MTMDKGLLRLATGLLAMCCIGWSQAEDLHARTADGRAVVLRANGTWSFLVTDASGKTMDVAGNAKRHVSRHGYVEVNYDPAKWEATPKQLSADAELSLRHKNGDAYFVLIAERVEIPIENFKEIALTNARELDPEARITSERAVSRNDGGEVVLDIEAKASGIPLHFRGYYWSSPAGSVQATAWTSTNLMDEYAPDIEQLLAGVLAHKRD